MIKMKPNYPPSYTRQESSTTQNIHREAVHFLGFLGLATKLTALVIRNNTTMTTVLLGNSNFPILLTSILIP